MDLRHTLLGAAMLSTLACAQLPASAPVAQVDGVHPATVRAVAGSVWVGQYLSSEPRSAWALPARGEVRDLHVVPEGEHGGFAVTFQQGGAVWQGRLDEDLHATSELAQVRDTAAVSRVAASAPTE